VRTGRGQVGIPIRCIALLAVGFVLPAAAGAADLPPAVPASSAVAAAAVPNWIVTVGLEGRVGPAWTGAPASELRLGGLPLFSVRRVGDPPPYFGPRDGIGFDVLDVGPFRFGPAFNLIWERKASSYSALNGLGNVNTTIQAGGFAEYWPAAWLRLRGELRQGFGGEGGVSGDGFLDAVIPFGQFRWSAGPRITVESAPAINPYFGITQAQSIGSAAAGLPALPIYHASGGLSSYGVGTQLEEFFSDQWAAHGFVEFQRLTDSAANSPLVTQRGSPDQWTFGLGATYSFAMHPLW
jgi:outer membrane protein